MAENDSSGSAFQDREVEFLVERLRLWGARESAKKGLIEKGEVVVPRVKELLLDDDPKVRLFAATILGAIGGDAALTALKIAQYDLDPKVSAEAMKGANKISHRERGEFQAKPEATYLGGHSAYPAPKDVKILTYLDYLEVPELLLTLPYDQLQNVQSITEERLKASRIFLVGIYAFAWKKQKVYLVITFNNAIGIEQNPAFDVERISSIQPFLYYKMINARLGR